MIEHPSTTVQQVSGRNPAGEWILSVLAKRTYVRTNGKWDVAPEQVPLAVEPVMSEAGELLTDIDLFPMKPMTDLVLLGNAHGRGRTQFDLNVAVNGQTVKAIRVFGDREVASLGNGQVFIGPAAQVDTIPLSYAKAYGGIDTVAELIGPNPALEVALEAGMPEAEAQQANRYRYPRNPIGRGYLIDANNDAAIDSIALPNFEDPLDLLSAKRIAAGHAGYWHKMPLPQSTGWVDSGWFPRLSYFGFFQGTLDEPKTTAEIDRGFAPARVLQHRAMIADDAFRLTQGASLGMQRPHFRGGEVLTFDNVTADGSRFTFTVPACPKIWIDGRKGTLKETEPVVHTVVAEPDRKRVTVLWRGVASALRTYLPEELAKMPLKVVW